VNEGIDGYPDDELARVCGDIGPGLELVA